MRRDALLLEAQCFLFFLWFTPTVRKIRKKRKTSTFQVCLLEYVSRKMGAKKQTHLKFAIVLGWLMC